MLIMKTSLQPIKLHTLYRHSVFQYHIELSVPTKLQNNDT